MSNVSPLLKPLVRPLTRAITEAGVGGGPSAFSAAKAAIIADAGDVNILVIGDSTSDGTTDWAYLLADLIADATPTHSVDYHAWNDATPAYDAPTAISAGSGANTINVYSASVSGSSPNYLMGSRFAAAIVAPDPDLVIWNHGHNLITGIAAGASTIRGEFISAMEMVRLALPNVAHAAMRQNPRRDDSQMASIVTELDTVAALYGDVKLIDGYARFIAAGKPAGWYADNVHPNATGSAELAAAAFAAWTGASPAVGFTVAPAFLDTTATNLLSNASFGTSYAGGTPVGWSQAGVATATVEAVIVDAPHTQSMQVDSTAVGAGFYFQQGSIDSIKGGKATFAVRAYVPAAAPGTACRVALLYNNGANVTVTSVAKLEGRDGWRWIVLAGVDIPANAVHVRGYLYSDTAASAGTTVYFDRAVLVAGAVPRDIQ